MYVNFQFIHRVAQATLSVNIKQLVWVVLVSGGGLGPKYGYFYSFFYAFQTAKIFFYFEVKRLCSQKLVKMKVVVERHFLAKNSLSTGKFGSITTSSQNFGIIFGLNGVCNHFLTPFYEPRNFVTSHPHPLIITFYKVKLGISITFSYASLPPCWEKILNLILLDHDVVSGER